MVVHVEAGGQPASATTSSVGPHLVFETGSHWPRLIGQ